MRPAAPAVLAAFLAAGAWSGGAWAADYRPAVCRSAVAYAGAPLHPPPSPADLDGAAGDLAGSLDPATAARLDAALDAAAAATRAHALTAAVGVPGQGLWQARRGADAASSPLFYWASVGKLATATVVLQLVEEGRLKLSDPVSRWEPDLPNGAAITVEHLLDHVGGLFSANEDAVVRRRGGRLSWDEELSVLRRHGALFCPGERWRYSNSGYAVLGRIVEQVDGRPLDRAIAARLISPLGLTGMRAIAPGDAVADIAAPVADAGPDRALDVRAPGAAGPLAATAADMVRFEQALLDGRLLKAETTRRRFERLYPMFQAGQFYGQGVMLYDVPDTPRPLYWIGHSGGGPGVRAVVAYAPRQRAFVAVALTGDGSAEAAANLLLKALAEP
ncbi:serine hydrolase domain-containing protein [Caulobacter sp. CCUG 60055]|uniref:serine hydrolase domain-containing protein n=1 Tax=Caulobacter sp. CCUG 60055 TaxID=2100090 RepID=UPI001FA75685